jgi:competence protein ComEA
MFNFKKYSKRIILLLVIIVLLVAYYLIYKIKFNDKSKIDDVVAYVDITSEVVTSEEETKNNFYVDVKGEVKNPGVYFVSDGMLVIDAINLAGGLTKKACTDDINLSMKLTKEMVIYINNKNNFTTTTKVTELNDVKITNKQNNKSNNELSGLVNINTASKEELMSITGIGESKANSIIEYRKENKFNSIEDIKNVSGIGDKFFEQIKDYITV